MYVLKAIPFANATTSVISVLYIVCFGIVHAAPSLMYDMFEPWLWITNIQVKYAASVIPYDKGLFGLVTISLMTWIVSYCTVTLYNRWAK